MNHIKFYLGTCSTWHNEYCPISNMHIVLFIWLFDHTCMHCKSVHNLSTLMVLVYSGIDNYDDIGFLKDSLHESMQCGMNKICPLSVVYKYITKHLADLHCLLNKTTTYSSFFPAWSNFENNDYFPRFLSSEGNPLARVPGNQIIAPRRSRQTVGWITSVQHFS